MVLRKVNPGIVVAIFVLGVFAFLLFSQFRSGDLVGDAIGTLDSGTIPMYRSPTTHYIDFSVNGPNYLTSYSSATDLSGNNPKYTSYLQLFPQNGATVYLHPTGTDFNSVTYASCTQGTAYAPGGGLILKKYGVACIKVDNTKYIKLYGVSTSQLKYGYLTP